MQNILDLVNDNDWDKILSLIKSGEYTNINQNLINNNNLYHIACVRGKTEFIKTLLKLKKENKVSLNTSLLNDDGEPGINLYYKFGGDDPSFFNDDDLCQLNSDNKNIILYILNNVNLLENLVDILIKKSCLENIDVFQDDALDIIDNILKKAESNKLYLGVFEKLYINLSLDKILFVVINHKIPEALMILVKHGLDPFIYGRSGFSPLAWSVNVDSPGMCIILLEYIKNNYDDYTLYKYIHKSKYYDKRPLFISFFKKNYVITEMLIEYMNLYLSKNPKITFDKEINSYKDTYLHVYLSLLQKELDDSKEKFLLDGNKVKILRFLINHTDLNQDNYVGITCTHLIFKKGLWKHMKDLLGNRKMDLLKTDDSDKNVYSYIEDKDKGEFMEFTKTIVVPLNNEEINEEFNLREFMNEDKKNYGLFEGTTKNYLLFMKYLENKHKSLYIPVRQYNEDAKIAEKFFLDLTSDDVSIPQIRLKSEIEELIIAYYSYAPHIIVWFDKDNHYIHPSLKDILYNHDKKTSPEIQRYVFIFLSIRYDSYEGHANALIYDRHKKEAWRFEPNGVSDTIPDIDDKLKELLESVYGKIEYYDPDNFLSGINFQMLSGEVYFTNQKMGDPGGYCLAWSLWFIDIVLSNPDKNIADIMSKFFNKKTKEKLSKNYYLDFIRNYSHKLDHEKNKILQENGIEEENYYDNVLRGESYTKFLDIFKVL